MAQAHTVRVNGGYSWRRGRENCTLDFSLLSEFVYMWKTLHCFSTEEIVIQSFITFELIQVVLFWTHCYFLIQLNNGFLLRLNVMSWHLSADSVFHIRLSFCKFFLFWFFISLLQYFCPLHLLFSTFSLCDQLFLFLLTTLWRTGCLHISYIAVESDLSLDQIMVGSRLVPFGCVKSITLVLPQPGYYYQEPFVLSCNPALLANWIPLS